MNTYRPEAMRSAVPPLRLAILAVPLFIGSLLSGAHAADIYAEQSDLGRLRHPALVVHVEGEIAAGDADRLRRVMKSNVTAKQRGVFFAFNSPGGNLLEGVQIGRVIAESPELTTSLVGTPDNPDAICASACIFAYLGAETREKGSEGRIGLHQFALSGNSLRGDEALSLGQQVSAMLASYLAERGVSAEVFSRMVRTSPGEMDWVSDAALAELGILAGEVLRQSSEFVNNSGKIVLKMDFQATTGEHMLLLGCNEPGIYVIASIVALDDAVSFSDAALILDDERVSPEHVEVMGFKDRRVVLLFVMSPELAVAATRATQIGSYYFDDDVQGWVGNMQDIDREKFADLVSSCVASG